MFKVNNIVVMSSLPISTSNPFKPFSLYLLTLFSRIHLSVIACCNTKMCESLNALHDLEPFVQFKKREKNP